MDTETKRGRTTLWLLLGAVCLLFLINVFYPLFLTSTYTSDRSRTFFVMLLFAGLAAIGIRYVRIVLGASLLFIPLMNALVLFITLSAGRLAASLEIAVISLVFVLVGWLLLTSKSIRAFEAARQSSRA